MSSLEENKILIEQSQEEVLQKIYQLKAKQLKEDKQIYQDYQPGWFENLLSFDISSLKEFENWMDNLIEKENEPELTQLWVFYRDIIRFSYYFLTFRWLKFAKENYFTLQAEDLFNDCITYLKEDHQKENLEWGKGSSKYIVKKIQDAYHGDIWKFVDETTRVARQFKNTSIEWFNYYIEYNKRLPPKIANFAINHAKEVQSYLWNNFSSKMQIWIKQFDGVPTQSLEYSYFVMENFILQNGFVRASFFEDLKCVVPVKAKQMKLYSRLQWNKAANKLYYPKDVAKNTINTAFISYFSVEESEILSLKQENLTTILSQEYPLRLQKGFNSLTLSFFYPFENENTYKIRLENMLRNNSQIEKKLDDIYRKKEERNERIAFLKSLEKKSDESVESRLKKLEEDFTKKQNEKEQYYSQRIEELEIQLQENSKIRDQMISEVNESKKIQEEEQNRQTLQRKIDLEWKQNYEKQLAKERKTDFVKNYVKKVDQQQKEQFQTKLQQLEEENNKKIEQEQRQFRRTQLELFDVFEKSFTLEQEKAFQLSKEREDSLNKDPETITLEKSKLEELSKHRLLDEEDENKRKEEQIALQKQEQQQKDFSNKMGSYFAKKQENLQLWINQKVNSINNISPMRWATTQYYKMITNSGEILLWFGPILNTLLYGPLDNIKLINQLGNKASYLYKKALTERQYNVIEKVIEPNFKELNTEQIRQYLKNKWESPQDPLTKGNLIRVLKHNIIGSDALTLSFFKIIQDKLMQTTSGAYQNQNNFIAGSLTGAIMAFFMNPLECFKTLYVATDLNIHLRVKNVNFANILCGLHANVASKALYRGIQFSLYENFKRSIYLKKQNLTNPEFEKQTSYFNYYEYNNHATLGQRYVSAVSASLIASVFAYPLDTARKLIYTNLYVSDPQQRLNSIREALSMSSSWYGGFRYNAIKQVFSPITLAIFDHAASRICFKSNIHNYLY